MKPRNTVALAGDKVTLRCATRKGGNAIRWSFDTEIPTCRQRHDHCDLVIESVQSSNAGGYDCTDGQSKMAQASLIVIGKNNNTGRSFVRSFVRSLLWTEVQR